MKITLAVAAFALSAVAVSPADARSRAARVESAAPAATVQLATDAATPIPQGPLSEAARPLRYRLDLTVDPAKERFSGKVEIEVTLARPATFIDLHGRDLAMHKVVAIAAGQTYPGTWKQEDPTGVARIRFDQPLPAGAVTLAFEYDAPFLDGAAGMFRVKVADAWYSWSQFQSIDARAAFPGFDQPSFKTPFALTVRTPPGLVAVGNAPETGVTQEAGLDVHRFADTLPLPTYLVAVMVGPFAVAAGEVAPTPQRARPLPLRIVATRPNADKLAFALDNSKPIVTLLEDYFGDRFPYPKLDQIASPIMPGAMENAGADLYGDNILMLGANATTADKRSFGMVVAHELAHQWFGDLVTPAWWDDIWLNESFANWMGYAIGDRWRPDLNIASGALEEGFAAMETDQLTSGRPIRDPIATNAKIDAAFDTITYGKGGHVVSMIAGFMGPDRFRDGVRRYMAAHRGGNATSVDFFTALAAAAGDPRIVPALRSFTDQQGVPLVTFARNETGGWTATQSRYLPLGANAPQQRWGIPLCVRRGTDRTCMLMSEDQLTIPAAGTGPLIPNAGGTGYYRFELSRADWDALVAQGAALDGGEALAVADSLSASVRSGNGQVRQLAALAGVLADHPDSYAADAAMGELSALVSGGVVGDAGRRGWRRMVLRTYRPVIDRLGFDPRAGAYAGEDPQQSQKRAKAVDRLSGAGRDPKVQTTLKKATDRFFSGQRQALDPAWFAAAFDLYLGRMGLDGAKALMETALGSEDPAFRPAALNAIAASGQRPIAHWLLEELKDPRLRASEQRGFLAQILAMRGTREYGYQWMRDNIDSLLGGGGIFYAAKMPQWLGRFCSVSAAEDLRRDLASRFVGKTGELEMARVIDKVRDCGVIKDQRGDAITAEFAAID